MLCDVKVCNGQVTYVRAVVQDQNHQNNILLIYH